MRERPSRDGSPHDRASGANVTIERRRRKERRYFLAAFAAFAFHGGVSNRTRSSSDWSPHESECPTPTDAEDSRPKNVRRLAEIGTAVRIDAGHRAHVEQIEEIANRLEPLPSHDKKLG